MHISFSPQRRDDTLTVIKSGDILTINGEAFDFSGLPDGAILPASAVPSQWIFGDVARADGAVHVTLVLPHGPAPSTAVAFPEALISPPDGPIAIPHDAQEPAHE